MSDDDEANAGPDDTGEKQASTRFQPGQSGNPRGRPKGARSKLSESFLKDMFDAWQQNGKAVIDAVIREDPASFLRAVVSVLPKELDVNAHHEHHHSAESVSEDTEWLRKLLGARTDPTLKAPLPN